MKHMSEYENDLSHKDVFLLPSTKAIVPNA